MGRMTSATVASWLLQLLSIGCGVAIVVIVAEKLWESVALSWDALWTAGYWTSGNICFMTTQDWNACAYTYVVCAVSWIVSLVILIGSCMDSRGCGMAASCTALFALLWWIAGATVATVYGVQADNDNWPRKDWRTAVWALGWAQVGLFALTLLAGLCCGRRKAAEEKPQQPQQNAGAGAGGAYPTGAYVQPPAAASYNPTYVTEYPPPPPPPNV